MKIALLNDTHFGVRNDSMIFDEYLHKFYDEIFFPYLDKHNIKTLIHLGDVVDRRKYINFRIADNFRKGFLNHVKKNGKYFNNGLVNLKNKYPKIIKEVRGVGLLLGLTLHKDQTKFIQNLLDNKLLTIRAAENVVRILPPLNVTKREINLALKILDNVCRNFK